MIFQSTLHFSSHELMARVFRATLKTELPHEKFWDT